MTLPVDQSVLRPLRTAHQSERDRALELRYDNDGAPGWVTLYLHGRCFGVLEAQRSMVRWDQA